MRDHRQTPQPEQGRKSVPAASGRVVSKNRSRRRQWALISVNSRKCIGCARRTHTRLRAKPHRFIPNLCGQQSGSKLANSAKRTGNARTVGGLWLGRLLNEQSHSRFQRTSAAYQRLKRHPRTDQRYRPRAAGQVSRPGPFHKQTHANCSYMGLFAKALSNLGEFSGGWFWSARCHPCGIVRNC